MKVTLSPSDIFEIRNLSLISSKDYEYVLDLYAPIVGIKKVSVYLAMLSETKNVRKPLTSFLSKYHLSTGELETSLSYLEAVGLILSFKNNNQIIFEVMAPKTPRQFFSHELLYGTLFSYLKESEIDNIKQKYKVGPWPEDGFENVSDTFSDVFHFDFDEHDANRDLGVGDRIEGEIALGFDYGAFNDSLIKQNPYFDLKSLSTDEVNRVARLAELYRYEESSMASFVLECFNYDNKIGRRVDFRRLSDRCREHLKYGYLRKEPIASTKSKIHGDRPEAREIRRMERLTPVEYLTRLQKNHKPSEKDLRLVERMNTENGVPYSVINAILFFLKTTKDGFIYKSYAEDLGATLVRQDIDNAKDALEFLASHVDGYKKSKAEDSKTELLEASSEDNNVENDEKGGFDAAALEAFLKNGGNK